MHVALPAAHSKHKQHACRTAQEQQTIERRGSAPDRDEGRVGVDSGSANGDCGRCNIYGRGCGNRACMLVQGVSPSSYHEQNAGP